MTRGLKGFAFLVSGLGLGIIGATASVTAIALSAVGMAKVRRASSPEWGSFIIGGTRFLLQQKARPSGVLSPSGV